MTEEKTQEQKALEILRVIAERIGPEDGKPLTFAPDWGFGSGTLVTTYANGYEGHTHFGDETGETDEDKFRGFINGLHDLLVRGCGLSWADKGHAAQGHVKQKEKK